MKAVRQTTLRDQIAISGVGVHSGVPVTLTIHPADADTGIVFSRSDERGQEREVRADYRAVTATELATVLGDHSGILCSTAEHVLAALRGLGVDNALVELDVLMTGWESDIDVAARDGEDLSGLGEVIKVTVEKDIGAQARELITQALDAAGLEYEIK